MARVFQDTRQKAELGKNAPWLVEWRVGGKRYSRKVGPKTQALEVAKQIDCDLMRSEFNLPIQKTWQEFKEQYEAMILPTMRSERSREESRRILARFEKTVNPATVRGVTRELLDEYVGKRCQQKGKKPGDKVSAQTIRKELRTIRAALSVAHEWKYLPVVPSLPRIKGLEKKRRPIEEAHFNALMAACRVAEQPRLPNVKPEAWWRALFAFLWIAPHRRDAFLALRWEDVDLEACSVLSRAEHNKQKRDHRVFFTPAVADLLRKIKGFDPRVFAWDHDKTGLYRQYAKIQKAAGINLPCLNAGDGHKCTSACHYYCFHDFRRSFASYNEDLPTALVTGQMGHSSYQTTLRYVKYGKDRRNHADKLHVPAALRGDVSATCNAPAAAVAV